MRHAPQSPPLRAKRVAAGSLRALALVALLCFISLALADEGATGSDLMQPDTMDQLDKVRDEMQAADKKPAPPPAQPNAVPSIDLGKPPAPIEPDQTDIETIPARVGLPAAKIDLDPSVIGVAPGADMPQLLREGQFIVNRRGKLQHVDGTGVLLIIFEPRPGQTTPDTPMVVQACTTVEIIEELVDRRGFDTPLIVSGQVHTYRGFNYLLPTVMEPAPPETETPESETPESETPAAETPAPTPDPAPVVDTPDVLPADAVEEPEDDVMAQLMNLRPDAAPADAPARPAEPRDPTRPLIDALGDLVPTAAKVKIDRSIIGIAPDQPMPPLKREGEFLVSRRGRLVRSAEGKSLLFVFEADSAAAPELPMVVQPCRLRESMEDLIQERGDSVVFIVSGQVHTYRGANYLLPTMMKLAVDKGNLLN